MIEEDLRKEVLAYQNAQAELRKWKFVAIGATAALGLGLADKASASGSRLALFILPLLALYPDLLLRDYDLRISVITAFIRRAPGISSRYEDFIYNAAEDYPWIFGHFAAVASTAATCIAAITMGALYLKDIAEVPPIKVDDLLPSLDAHTSGALLVGSGVVGVALILVTELGYHRKIKKIESKVDQWLRYPSVPRISL